LCTLFNLLNQTYSSLVYADGLVEVEHVCATETSTHLVIVRTVIYLQYTIIVDECVSTLANYEITIVVPLVCELIDNNQILIDGEVSWCNRAISLTVII
jgi:hypothetical protein